MGGKSQKAPDYSGMEAVAREQLNFSRQQYADMRPIVEGIANQQMAAQEQQMAQAQDYYNYMQDTYRPVEQGLVAQAQNFNTDAYRQQMAQQASAASARAFDQSQAMTNRSLAARGVNPASGAARGANTATMLQQTAMRTQGMTGARQQAESLGYARMLDAAGLGRGLAGASTAAYGSATNAGSQASNVAQSAGVNYQNGLAGAGNTFGNMASTQASVYNAGLNATGEMFGAALGAAGTLGAAGIAASDRRLKEDVDFVGVDDVTGLNLYEFNYIGDSDRRFIGVMADEVMEYMPEAVIESDSGYFAVDYDMLGIEMVEV